jgi:5-methyltetrahydropteroyltriglutamate--homocysteine methyltransferase
MVESYDVGSLPFVGDFAKFLANALYLEEKVVASFMDKLKVGVDVPNYPQFRDINKMFLESIAGLEKIKDSGYVEAGSLSIKPEKAQIPEVAAIENQSGDIHEKIGRPLRVKICVTGPYTLASLFAYKDSGTFGRLGEIVSQIVEKNIFKGKHGGVRLVAIDEPTFGLLDDPLLDYGGDGRETLREAWESICRMARAKGVQTCIHLHNTADELFWDVESLNIVESHVQDPLYHSNRTKELLESKDKTLKASIATSDFDKLIRAKITAELPQKTGESTINEKVAEVWKAISKGKLTPENFLETTKLMAKRLKRTVNRFGVDRVPYAGPECGLKSFPTYEFALELLRRSAAAVKAYEP